MYQFCYASETTSSKANLLNDLTNILSEARDFNYRHGISGALYFADGHFFQCLEGEKSVLDILLAKLGKDKRHQKIRIFEMHEIQQRCFQDWDMKYISRRDSIHAFCQSLGFDSFKPQEFNQQQVNTLLEQLMVQVASEAKTEKA